MGFKGLEQQRHVSHAELAHADFIVLEQEASDSQTPQTLLKRNSLASEVDYIPDLAFSNSAVVQVDGVEGGRNAFGVKKALSLLYLKICWYQSLAFYREICPR